MSEATDSTTNLPSKRTWSRELSLVLLLGLATLIYFEKKEMVEIVIWPIVAFTLPAFGFKQPTLEAWMSTRK
jgi:hypothetical protein